MWSEEEAKDLKETYGAAFAKDGQDAAVRAVAIRAIELVRARGGTMTTARLVIFNARILADGLSKTEQAELLGHSEAQGATVATLQAKAEELENRDAGLYEEGFSAGKESAEEELRAKVEELERGGSDARAERDAAREDVSALRAEVERLKAAMDDCREAHRLVFADWKAAETRLAAVRAELGAHDEEEGPDLLATIEGIRAALEGDAPQEAKEATTCRAERNAPDGRGFPVTCSGRHTLRDGDHISDGGEVFSDFAARYPCSPTRTHDDAATPGHHERVEERSEAVAKALGGVIVERREPTTEEQGAYIAGFDDGERSGAEAMRAACWEAVIERLVLHGLQRFREDFKRAIEGATP